MKATADRLVNLRDVAQVVTVLRPGLLLRSDAPHPADIDPAEVTWPPNLVIDLRGGAEHGDAHPLEAAAVIRRLALPAPVWAGEDADPYGLFFSSDVGHRLREIIGEIAKSEGAVLVHCVGGKDRTGVAIALALRLCGVARGLVLADYLLSDEFREGLYLRHVAAGIAVSSPDDPALRTAAAPFTRVLDHWDAHPGGVRGWFLDQGGDDETIVHMRQRLLNVA